MSDLPGTPSQREAVEKEAYVRGLDAGRIEQRLLGHDERLQHINGSIDSMTGALDSLTKELRSNLNRLGAELGAERRNEEEREKISATVATALRERSSDVAARSKTRWTRWQRWAAVLGTLLVAGNSALTLYLAFRH